MKQHVGHPELFDGMPFSNVLFDVRGKCFRAHKNILAAGSAVFAALFKNRKHGTLSSPIVIQDVDPDVFQTLLRFIYMRRLNKAMLHSMAARLSDAAKKYGLKALEKTCATFLRCQEKP
jgi:speckle-type POZ protein